MLLKSVKKTAFLLLIIGLCGISYYKLNASFNPKSVDFIIQGGINNKQVEAIEKYLMPNINNIEYRGYGGEAYWMNSGDYNKFSRNEILQGRAPVHENEIALGKELGQNYFKTKQFIGLKYPLYDKSEAIVVGVLKEKNAIWIPYNQQLADQEWESVKLSLHIEGDKNYYPLTYQTKRYIETLEIKVQKMILYQEKFMFFKNISILAVVFIFIIGLKLAFYLLKKHYYLLYNYVHAQKRIKDGRKLIRETLDHIYVIAVMISFIIYGTIKSIKLILSMFKIDRLTPQNFLALGDYWELIQNLWQDLLVSLSVGLSGIELLLGLIVGINLILLLIGYLWIDKFDWENIWRIILKNRQQHFKYSVRR